MNANDKRDFREETALNAAEFQSLRHCSARLGLTKSATLRLALHLLCDQITRQELQDATGIGSEDIRD